MSHPGLFFFLFFFTRRFSIVIKKYVCIHSRSKKKKVSNGSFEETRDNRKCDSIFVILRYYRREISEKERLTCREPNADDSASMPMFGMQGVGTYRVAGINTT